MVYRSRAASPGLLAERWCAYAQRLIGPIGDLVDFIDRVDSLMKIESIGSFVRAGGFLLMGKTE
jgi:hypothetical protein